MAITINHQTNDISATSGSLTIDGAAVGGGGGAWNLLATTTVTSAVTSVEFTDIGNFNRYALKWDCVMDGAQIPRVRIYDNGTLVTSSSYAMLRKNVDSNASTQTTSSGWLGAVGLVSQIGHFEISTAHPRATVDMAYGGFTGTTNTANYLITTGGMVSGYSITGISGFSFITTAETSVILSGRFSLYGLGQ